MANPNAVLTGGKATAHQVRGMASSVALFTGVPIAVFWTTAVWYTATTFVTTFLKDFPSRRVPLLLRFLPEAPGIDDIIFR